MLGAVVLAASGLAGALDVLAAFAELAALDATAMLAEDDDVVGVGVFMEPSVDLAAAGFVAPRDLAAGFFAFATTHTLMILAKSQRY